MSHPWRCTGNDAVALLEADNLDDHLPALTLTETRPHTHTNRYALCPSGCLSHYHLFAGPSQASPVEKEEWCDGSVKGEGLHMQRHRHCQNCSMAFSLHLTLSLQSEDQPEYFISQKLFLSVIMWDPEPLGYVFLSIRNK